MSNNIKTNIREFPKKKLTKEQAKKKKILIRRKKARIRRRIAIALIIFSISILFIINRPDKGIMLDVPLISQMPELQNGCEITSTAMLLDYTGAKVDKIGLADEMKKDKTEIQRDEKGYIRYWGNPKDGFVGDVTGKEGIGYSIDPCALEPLVSKYYDKGALNLTGTSIKALEENLKLGKPIVVWVTSDFSRPREFEYWKDKNGNEVKAYFLTHAILLTGYDEENFYYNDPLNNKKDEKVSKGYFKTIWREMGEKALTIN